MTEVQGEGTDIRKENAATLSTGKNDCIEHENIVLDRLPVI